ncbi:hypothetical protein [Celeribacter sp. SCSIO 80788]|uniref:hypothetical protein n=1 Tax=Celeribacter sp. SCSIO 80788 TaxID=3117013 RepID=UPI003DA61F9E
MPRFLSLTALALLLASPALADCQWSINRGIDSFNDGVDQQNEAADMLNRTRQAAEAGDMITTCSRIETALRLLDGANDDFWVTQSQMEEALADCNPDNSSAMQTIWDVYQDAKSKVSEVDDWRDEVQSYASKHCY